MKKITALMSITVLAILGSITITFADVISTELEDVLNAAGSSEEISVIVTLVEKEDIKAFKDKNKGLRRSKLIKALKNKADLTQGPLVATAISKGAKGIKKFWIINGIAFRARVEVIREVAKLPGVESVRLDATLSAPDVTATISAPYEWNLNTIRAFELWDRGYTGDGIVVAGMDTGVDQNHQDISSKWRGGENSWFDPHGEHTTPYDASGHGTQTMGIIVGGDGGGTAIGVAPGAQWIAIKIYNDAGESSLSAIHQGFQWILDPDGLPDTNDVPDIVNNSWGFENNPNECISEFAGDIETLKAAGVAVVFSGGNKGPSLSSSVSSANNPAGFATGAIDESLTLTAFSSRGPSACDGSIYPEIVAPGINIKTSDLTFGGVFPDSYINVTGTSFAVPHVAGAMALLLNAVPGATVLELESALMNSALDLGVYGPDNSFGYGLVDCMGAYNLLVNADPCTDIDGDGYYGEANCGTSQDCNDTDPGTNPGACDIKGDGIDQNCDGQDRTKGKPCPVIADPGGDPGDTGGTEGKGKTCSDGLDNDGDEFIDCADSDCSRNKACK